MFAFTIKSMSKFHSLRVAAINKESQDTHSITLEVPATLQATFAFQAGQYLTIKLDYKGEEIRRSYSMSSAPKEEHLTGDQLEVMAPEGRFTAKPNADIGKSYYLFAGGSGITPIMSIIRTILEDEPLSTLHLLYSSRNEENIIFESKLAELVSAHQDQLIVDHVLSQPKKNKPKGLGGWFKKASSDWDGKSGRINKAMVKDFLNEHPARNQTSVYYLCGPGGFMETVKGSLEEAGVQKENIFVEFFTSADATAAPAATAGSGNTVVSAQLTYMLDKQESSITVPVGKTVLETLLDGKVDAPFSCQSGACSTCMCKVEAGSVTMDTCLALDDDEVADGYVLACQARPTSAELKINFDI